VADDGQPLSLKSIDKIFVQLRETCPGLAVTLTSHVMRHTWNERFSEQAELMGLTDAVEEKARNCRERIFDQALSSQTTIGAERTSIEAEMHVGHAVRQPGAGADTQWIRTSPCRPSVNVPQSHLSASFDRSVLPIF
jgi:hypothetical protein